MSIANFSNLLPAAPAGFNNVNFQSDVNGNLSAYDPGGARLVWTPAVTPQTSMVISAVSAAYATYLRVGPLVYVAAQVSFTCAAPLEAYVNVSMPILPAGVAGNGYTLAAIVSNVAGNWVPAVTFLLASGLLRVFAGANAGTNYTANAQTVILSGWYPVT